jgi:hypothetical protein
VLAVTRYVTVIPTHGPAGNVFAILGAAVSLMRQLGHSNEEIARLRTRVLNSHSYDEACAAVREWFPLESDR